MNAPVALRGLPSVDAVLRHESGAALAARHGRVAATAAIRAAIADLRGELVAHPTAPAGPGDVAARAGAALEALARPTLGPILNLTGTVLHTNFGRAILAEAAIGAAVTAMRNAVALEYDVAAGRRGERDDHVRTLLCELTGAEDATVVNNNAAAVLLVLNTFGRDRESIVSRGELIEIGGAFRLPAIMERAGTRLREVGTTNRTHPRDYEEAMGPETGLVLKVHTSNYRVEGFTAEVQARRLVEIARPRDVPVLHDLGSGTLVDLVPFGLAHETTVREAVADGADLVTFSGDKLLGGPQAGFVAGRRDLLAAIARNPMKRALRVDKIRLAAVAATLELYRRPETLAETVPTLRFLSRAERAIRASAERLAPELAGRLGPAWDVSVESCGSQIGSGALPVRTIPSAALAVRPAGGGGGGLDALAERLRRCPVPIVGRIAGGALLLDLRTLDSEAALLASLDGLPA